MCFMCDVADEIKRRFFEVNSLVVDYWQCLSVIERKIIFLYYFCDWKLYEIANNFGYSSSYVGETKRKAIQKIKGKIKHE